MASLEERLAALEALRAVARRGQSIPHRMKRLFAALEDRRRAEAGLDPAPEISYTEEDREEDRDTLDHTIPTYRESSGWQTDEGRAFLDQWERRLQDKLETGA